MESTILEAIFTAFFITAYQIVLTIFLFYSIYIFFQRKKFLTVNIFENSKQEFPSVLKLNPNEYILQYARSLDFNNRFYFSNQRFIFHHRSRLLGKISTRYFSTKSIINTEITYKNPYAFIIFGIITFITILTYGIKAASKQSLFSSGSFNEQLFILIMVGNIIFSSLLIFIWYYLRGYYLVLDNIRLTGLFCRSQDGLESIIKKYDLLKHKNDFESNGHSENTLQHPDEIANESTIETDYICIKCNSMISLEGDELKNEIFTCPVCNTVNKLK